MWSCPHTPLYCGRNEMHVAPITGKINSIKPQSNYLDWFKAGESCKYKIVFPSDAGRYDKIAVKVNELSNTRLMTVDTDMYKSYKFKENEFSKGDIFTFEYPNILFAVFLTNNTNELPGDFDITYAYVDRNSTNFMEEDAIVEALGLAQTKGKFHHPFLTI
jgi:hypothetical protein